MSPPKIKRVLCVRLEEDHFLGFFFNTRVSRWATTRPDVVANHLPFAAGQAIYLDVDCFLDLTQIFVFQYFQNWELLGDMALHDAERVRAAIRKSLLLAPVEICRLLD